MILDEYIPIFLNLLAQFIELNVEEVSSNLEQISVIKQEEPIIIDYYFAGTKIFPNLFNEFKIYHLSGFIDYEKLNKISNLYFYPLPYKTINREFDVMPAFRLNTIYLPSKNEVYKNTIVGISRFEIDRRNRFQVLLNESLKPCREEYSNDYNCK